MATTAPNMVMMKSRCSTPSTSSSQMVSSMSTPRRDPHTKLTFWATTTLSGEVNRSRYLEGRKEEEADERCVCNLKELKRTCSQACRPC